MFVNENQEKSSHLLNNKFDGILKFCDEIGEFNKYIKLESSSIAFVRFHLTGMDKIFK